MSWKKKTNYSFSIGEMIFNKCYTEGEYTLHSGDSSNFIFDVLKVVHNPIFINYLPTFLKNDNHLVGIEFGGALIAAMSGKPFSIVRKDGTIYGSIPDNYTLVDDVVTTERSLREAIDFIDKYPYDIKCIVDRRVNETAKICSVLRYKI